MREDRRLSVFERRVMRRIFGPKKEKVTGNWIKVHNEELTYLYSASNAIRVLNSSRMK
jgi:hypothetical protein